MITIALDFESMFDDECTITKLGNRGYFNHPKFDAYLLSAVSDDGIRWVGHPCDFDWSLLEGATVLSHNASFDEGLYLEGVLKGHYPKIAYASWECTLDTCSFHGIRRSLKNAVKDLFDVELSKATRDAMQGLDWATMSPEFRKEVEEYALLDAEWCLKIWEKLSPTWPEFERRISRHTREMCRRGIAVDEPRLRQAIEDLSVMRFELESDVPWVGERALKSRIAFDLECRKHGLTPPKSLAKSDPAAEAWFAEHEDKHAWMAAYRNVGRVNTMLLKLQTLERQTIEGVYYPHISYHSAHTGRFSSGGGTGVNIQNLTKGEMFGVNLREMFVARPGKKFAVVDLSQIEVRTALWLAGAKKALEEIRKTDDLYHALAVAFELWTDEQGPLRSGDPKLRQGTKIVGLGVLYGASAKKVAMIAKIPLEEAEKWVRLVKTKFPEVPKLWDKLTNAISRARSCSSRKCELRLPSGRAIQYRNIRYQGDGLVCDILKGANYMTVRPWFGMTCENISQGMARDTFMDGALRVEELGFPILFHVHDEIIVEVDDGTAEDDLGTIIRAMSTSPEWIPDLPLDAEGHICGKYTK
jgi:DNA polymerase I-like protein with 3'-5' exonuclease and polymerase domains